MKTNFNCKSFEDIIFSIGSEEFKYKECEILAERIGQAVPVIDIVLKSPKGLYAEIIVRSNSPSTKKVDFVQGYYVGQIVSNEYATESAALTNAFK